MNPEPVAPIFDAIVIGEGEEVVDDLIDLFRRMDGAPRRDLLAALDHMNGIYVPALVPSGLRAGR